MRELRPWYTKPIARPDDKCWSRPVTEGNLWDDRSDAQLTKDKDMNLRSRLFKKPWQAKDAKDRAQAVQDSEDPDLRADLPQLAQHDPAVLVRLAALRRLDTEPFWLDARLRETDPELVSAADAFLLHAVTKPGDPNLTSARGEWLKLIDDPAIVRRLAQDAADVALRRIALGQISSQGFLGDRYMRETDAALAAELLSRIDRESTLKRLIEGLRTADKQRAQAARERLDQLRARRGETDPQAQAASNLVEAIEALLHHPGRQDLAARLAELEQQWRLLESTDDALQRRFSGAAQILHSSLKPTTAESETGTVRPETGTEHNDRPEPAAKNLRNVAERLTEFRATADPKAAKTLLAEWDRAWNALDTIGPADTTLKNEVLPQLRALQAQTEQARTASAARSSNRHDQQQAIDDLNSTLERIAALLEQGDIAAASKALAEARSDYQRLPGKIRPKRLGGRLTRLEGRAKEMSSWQHWSNNQHRDELIERVEQLADAPQHPDAIAAALKEARGEWKRLEELETVVGNRRRQHAAPAGQWRRFQAACDKAYELAKPYLEKRQQCQQDNLAQLEAFISNGMELAANEQADAAAVLGSLRGARQAIRRLDEIPPRSRGRSARDLRELMKRLEQRVNEANERIVSDKRSLIAEARVLSQEDDLASAIARAKGLQAQWQKIGRGQRKTDQQLWREFREPIDELFVRLKEKHEQHQQIDESRRAEIEALCQRIEELAKLPDAEIGDAVGAVKSVISDWSLRADKPGEMIKRFEAAERRFRRRLDELAERVRNQAQQQTLDLAESVQALWVQRSNGQAGALQTSLAETPAGSDLQLINELRARCADLSASDFDPVVWEKRVAEHAENARQVTVEAEFLSGLKTPEKDRERRMNYQVKRLSERLTERARQPDLGEELEQLERRWLLCFPLPPGILRELEPRYRASRQSIRQMIGSA